MAFAKKVKTHHKIALYIRVSTEEQAKNPEGSIKSQEQRLRQYVEFKNMESRFGEVAAVFIDRAKSGKDTKRPQLQRLLRAIRNQEVTIVMVSELSRLSRSIRDFSDIWELMQTSGCDFLSLREQFDTTTAAGEMVLYTIANISQFERKQVSERVSANFDARAKRGLFNGGTVPLGYKKNPDLSGHLLVDEEHAELVREIFNAFLTEGSLAKTAIFLNKRGLRIPRKRIGSGGQVRLGYFVVDNVQSIIKNKSYIGIRVYQEDGEEKTAKAAWPAIVDVDIFNRVQNLLRKNHEGRLKTTTDRRYPYILSGLTVCGQCGNIICGKSAHGEGGKIAYYEHAWAVKKQSTINKEIFECKPTRVLAKILEPIVWDEIVELLTGDQLSKVLLDKAQKAHVANGTVAEVDRLRSKIRGFEEQQDALAEHLAKIPKSVSPTPIYSQMERIELLKKGLLKELDDLLSAGDYIDEPANLRDYNRYLQTIKKYFRQNANADEKAKIIRALIAKIEILPEKVKIYYKVGSVAIKSPIESQPSPETELEKQNEDTDFESGLKTRKAGQNFFWTASSNRLTNSAPGQT